ncbi:hypothetical protein NitYY0826_C1882 [Nitratiruptor sp. YY08-26]|uniref:EAL domain-containing protein n=1 Tax=unclassified Nitratiruptor TaxID=2624044 RepID=UPI001915B4FB|nr:MULTISPECIES: GGDEF domain-containing phosphodiesterase [unclassified Nitratiruptor]BCD62994.1 hypothetical protein NitYY0813_C1880 [Nitratiruptor sp. YY08-13]BCD66929.1 hypothetical protein NitYY0826_C1882 [Nitratiruptor sp. YY08-26]
MIALLSQMLSETLEDEVEIVSKKEFAYPKERKFFAIDSEYVFIYNKYLMPKKLHIIKTLLAQFIRLYQQNEDELKKLKIIHKEVDNILHSNELFFEKKGDIASFFSFLHKEDIQFVLIENGKVLFNNGIDTFTIETTLKKLKKAAIVSLPIGEGALFATNKGFYTIILLKKRGSIDPFIKKLMNSRLLWINALYEARVSYEVDRLTGLYTRSKFLTELPMHKKRSFIFINIKNFKVINQLYNDAIGDRVLQELAQRFRQGFGHEHIYRIYGDRFAIICEEKELQNFIDILWSIEAQVFLIYNDETKEYIEPQLKFGVFVSREYHDEMLELANIAFKQCQKALCYYKDDIKPMLQEEVEYTYLLTRALDEDGIKPYFQKVIDKKSDTVYYYEVLMRIIIDEKVYPPVKFLDIAKKKGLYKKLSTVMIEKAIAAAKKLQQRVSINIDIFDILEKDFITSIQKLLQKYQIASHMLQFEILETEDIYQYSSEVKAFISTMRSLGIGVALDDFGKGYSNFAIIKDFDLDLLKIDMSIVRHIGKSEESFLILKSIAEFASLLHIDTTAEGVGSEEVYQKLLQTPINYLQGFFIDKPKPLEEILIQQ